MADVATESKSWPRLYLDTAEILRIADQKTDGVLVRQLSDTMMARHFVLVVSIEHLQDSLPKSDETAGPRIASAIEQFRLSAIVLRSPSEIEPWSEPNTDIDLAPASNIREIITHPRALPVTGQLASVQESIHASNLDFQKAQAFAKGTRTKREFELALRVLTTLVRGWQGSDVEAILDYWLAKGGLAISPSTRFALSAQLQPVALLMRKFDDDPRFDDRVRLSILTQMRDSFGPDAFVRSPGMFLAARLATCRTKNATRIPSSSDPVDGMHAMYFPYVDVATCDRQTYACLRPHFAKVSAPRRPIVFRNGQLPEVIRAIESFPLAPIA